MGSTHWGIERYLGADALGVTLGALYLFIGLLAALVAAGYFHRRKGPAWAFGFAALYWALNFGLMTALARGKPAWQSLVSLGISALITFGFAAFLALRRGRPPAGTEDSAPTPPAQRKCPGCGLTIDGRYEKCPMCGAKRQS